MIIISVNTLQENLLLYLRMKKRSIVFIAKFLFVFLFGVFLGEGNSNLFASGSLETPLIRTKTDVDFIQEDPILSDLVFNRSKTKRSLAYLRAVAEAKNALIRQDYFSAVKSYSDLIVVYGEDVELLYGLAETYFALGYQETSFSYYDKVVKSSSQNQSPNEPLTIFEMRASYRLAYLYYQNNAIDEFLRTLSRIISTSDEFDDTIMSLVETQSLDYILNLFKRPLDYSYIARREMGIYYSYNGFNNDSDNTPPNRDIATRNETATIDRDNDSYILLQRRNEKAVIYLISVLSMAVDTFTKYLQTTHLGYEFTTLDEMFELLQETDKGQDLIQSFDVARVLIGIRKYYNYEGNENSQKEFLSFYCTDLLETIKSFDNEQSAYIYSYYPNLE